MKLIQISAHYSPNIGGVETHLNDLVTELVKKNYQVTVLTYRPLMTKARWKLFENSKNLKIFRIPWLPGLFNKLLKYPILEFLYLTSGLFIVLPIVLFFEKYELIHAHGIASSFVAVIWGKIFNIPVVISTHSLYEFPKTGIYVNFIKKIFSQTKKIICLSEQSRNEIISLGIASKNIRKFTYWINLDNFSPIPKNTAKKEIGYPRKFIVLYVGRLVPEKGIPELLEASSLVNKSVSILIAGTGILAQKIIDHNSHNIFFLGPVDQSKLPIYYSAADLLIVPSMHEEGFGRVILESLACGTPVIAANRGAIPEAMTDQVGRLVEINPKNIAKNINELYLHPHILSKYQSKSRSFAETNYSSKNINSIIESYQ